MKNLAGSGESDKFITEELTRCGITTVQGDRTQGEVKYTVTGKLGAFTFSRAWYYWCVEGRLPLAVAEELYADVVGRRDIRVAGHCGCPPPADWAQRFNEQGQMATSPEEFEKGKVLFAKFSSGTAMEDWTKNYFPCPEEDKPKYPAFITSYHIDSELGLYIFAQTLRKHNLT